MFAAAGPRLAGMVGFRRGTQHDSHPPRCINQLPPQTPSLANYVLDSSPFASSLWQAGAALQAAPHRF
eukprot:1162097-Pelagomonas_calceolata.AAC.4